MNDIRAVQMKPVCDIDNEYTRTVDMRLCNRGGELEKLEQHDKLNMPGYQLQNLSKQDYRVAVEFHPRTGII
jgi:hypothetical protein